MKSLADAVYLALEMTAFFAILLLLYQSGVITW